MAPFSVGLFLYFRSSADIEAVLAALHRAGRLLAAQGWPAPSLWRRSSSDGAASTWMQVHAPQPSDRIDALCTAIERSLADSALQPLIAGSLHVERFESYD